MSPTVASTPDIVVYDGDCGICEASANWITSHVPGVRVVSHRAHGLDRIDAVWFITNGNKMEGALAVAAILRRARSRTVRAVGLVIGLPVVRSLAAVVYSLVARNRRRLSSLLGLRACAIEAPPAPDVPHG